MGVRSVKFPRGTARIAKVREGFEGGIYDLAEAKVRIAGHQAAMAMAEEEVRRPQVEAASPVPGVDDLESLRNLVRSLQDKKLDLICKLDVKVYPSEGRQVYEGDLPSGPAGFLV